MYTYTQICTLFAHRQPFFFLPGAAGPYTRGRVGYGTHREPACTLHARSTPGRAAWRAPGAFKVATRAEFSRGMNFHQARAKQKDGNPHEQKMNSRLSLCFCVLYVTAPHLASGHPYQV